MAHNLNIFGPNTHSIHGTGIFTYIYHGKNQPNVGKCTSPMDPCPWYGIWICYRPSHLPKFRLKSKISRPNRRLHPRPFPPFEAGNIIKAVAACFASAFAARGFGDSRWMEHLEFNDILLKCQNFCGEKNHS